MEEEKENAEENQSKRDKVMRGNLHGNVGDKVNPESQGFEWVSTRRPSRSEVWKKFGFKRFPNKKAEYCKVYCKLCGLCQKYNSSTNNMKFHIHSKHSIDNSDLFVRC